MSKDSFEITEKEQLELLKDSIELRFTGSDTNEFSQISAFDPSRLNKFQLRRFDSPQMLEESFIPFSTEEADITHKSIRQLCGITLLVALFMPFIQTSEFSASISGINLIATTFGMLFGQVEPNSWGQILTILPASLVVFGALLTVLPRRWGITNLVLQPAWTATICIGITHFFVSSFFYSEIKASAGIGYYLAMIAVFAFYFLNKWANDLTQPDSSTAKL